MENQEMTLNQILREVRGVSAQLARVNKRVEELDDLLFETRLTNDMLATLIRSLTTKGVISKADFSGAIAFGKLMNLNDLVFGMNKR